MGRPGGDTRPFVGSVKLAVKGQNIVQVHAT